MSKLDKVLETIRDSEAFQQLKAQYDELDAQSKLYLNLGGIAAVAFAVFLSIVLWMGHLSSIKSDIDEKEDLIGYLQRSADSIKTMKAQQKSPNAADASAPLAAVVDAVINTSGLDRGKVEVSQERSGAQEKDTVESLVDVKLSQVNLRQVVRFLFTATDMGAARGLSVKDLTVDTKGDPSGYMDATATLSAYKAK
jgi:type II secretory pathway component PulM